MTRDKCPIERTLQVIGSKWTILILRELLPGPRRFGQLLQALPGASPKTLAARLRDLERAGILTRTPYPEVPPRVDYALTAKGRSLSEILDAMREWGRRWEGKTEAEAAAAGVPLAAPHARPAAVPVGGAGAGGGGAACEG